MVLRTGILIFEDVEELDFVGPWEVFNVANQVAASENLPQPFECMLVAEKIAPVRCRKGMRVLPDVTTADAGRLDILLVPGGQGTRREVDNAPLLAWIAQTASQATWITSVCTGALLLTAAGPAKGKKVTTHWGFIETLRARGEAAKVLENVRYVRDANVVTAAGMSAGIDMALWLTGQILKPSFARKVQRVMEYDPAPPYAAAV